jgi:hypothetical protein
VLAQLRAGAVCRSDSREQFRDQLGGCIALRSQDTVALQSRQHRSLTRYFPEIAAAVAELDVDVGLDGVIWGSARGVHDVVDWPWSRPGLRRGLVIFGSTGTGGPLRGGGVDGPCRQERGAGYRVG